jgi:hypothetical protein
LGVCGYCYTLLASSYTTAILQFSFSRGDCLLSLSLIIQGISQTVKKGKVNKSTLQFALLAVVSSKTYMIEFILWGMGIVIGFVIGCFILAFIFGLIVQVFSLIFSLVGLIFENKAIALTLLGIVLLICYISK